jgi:hypothetical protein
LNPILFVNLLILSYPQKSVFFSINCSIIENFFLVEKSYYKQAHQWCGWAVATEEKLVEKNQRVKISPSPILKNLFISPPGVRYRWRALAINNYIKSMYLIWLHKIKCQIYSFMKSINFSTFNTQMFIQI